MPANKLEQLTSRECEVLALAAEGLSNRGIARRLEPPCAEHTVKKHLHSVFLKLGVESRAGAVAKWVAHRR